MSEKKVHLTCGTRFYVEDAPSSGVYIEVEDVVSFGGEIGQIGTFLESTTVTDCAKDYIGGLSDAPDLTVSYLISPTTNQSNFKAAAIASEKRKARIVFADKGAGAVITADFSLAMAGYTVNDPAPDTILTGNVNGKASKFIWS